MTMTATGGPQGVYPTSRKIEEPPELSDQAKEARARLIAAGNSRPAQSEPPDEDNGHVRDV